jgi:divalent metal cation (Fe/Co/Zn/Cd) transporter
VVAGSASVADAHDVAHRAETALTIAVPKLSGAVVHAHPQALTG